MKRLMYVIPLSAVAVLLLAAPALTQNAPNHIDASPTQTTDAKQITGNAATDPTTTPSETTAPAESTTPAPDSSTLPRVRQLRSSIEIVWRTPSPQTMDCLTQGS